MKAFSYLALLSLCLCVCETNAEIIGGGYVADFDPAIPKIWVGYSGGTTSTDANGNSITDCLHGFYVVGGTRWPSSNGYYWLSITPGNPCDWSDPRGYFGPGEYHYMVGGLSTHYEPYNHGWIEGQWVEDTGHWEETWDEENNKWVYDWIVDTWRWEPGYWDAGFTATDTSEDSIELVATIPAPLPQTITVNPVGTRELGDTFAVTATAMSGLPVSFTVISGPATIVNVDHDYFSHVSWASVRADAVGSVQIRADQAGGLNWNDGHYRRWQPASSVFTSFTITKKTQAITFDTPATVAFGSSTTLGPATSVTGYQVRYAVLSGNAEIALEPGEGLTRKYWDSPFLYGPTTTTTSAIDFPGPSFLPSWTSYFAARWTGFIIPRFTETYTISTEVQGRVKVWVNDTRIINDVSTIYSHATFSANVAMTAGVPMAITVEFDTGSTDRAIVLRWQSASQSLEAVPASQLSPGGVMLRATGPGPVVVRAVVPGNDLYNGGVLDKTITVLPLAPAIMGPASLAAVANQVVSVQLTASNSPTSWSVTGLPIGLAMSQTGLISGSAPAAGNYDIVVSAVNTGGTGSRALRLTSYPPVSVSSTSVGGVQGSALSFTPTVSGSPTAYSASGLPAGLSINPGTGQITGIPIESGTFTVSITASNPASTATGNLTFSVSAAGLKPGIVQQPANSTVVAGQAASFSISAVGSAPITYQWRKDGSNLAGKTDATLALTSVQAADAGDYSVVVSNAAGQVSSRAATLALATAVPSSPLATGTASGDPSADGDGDGIPDRTETALGVTANAAPTVDSSVNINVQRPPQ